jgi:hypothetical protein
MLRISTCKYQYVPHLPLPRTCTKKPAEYLAHCLALSPAPALPLPPPPAGKADLAPRPKKQ